MSETLNDFIVRELAALEAYDGQRPVGHPYAFHEHSKRVAADMRALADALGRNDGQILYQLTLVHDIGKRLLPVSVWDVDGKPDDATKALRRAHTSNGVKLVDDAFGADNHASELDLMRDLMAHHHEAMDGSGWMGLTGDQLSFEARMLCVCDAFDGYSTWRPHFGARDISAQGVLHRMGVEKAGQFDPDILAVFATLKA
jgi:HD-GYP domain-containing protein (c-di-GMP phosphodiesterase class II)